MEKKENTAYIFDNRKQRFIEYYKDNFGIITVACGKANISRQTYYDWLKSDAEFSKKIDEIEPELIGQVKDRLLKGIYDGDLPSIRFYLERKSQEFKNKTEIDVYNRTEIDKVLKDLKEYIDAHKPKNIQDNRGATPLADPEAKRAV